MTAALGEARARPRTFATWLADRDVRAAIAPFVVSRLVAGIALALGASESPSKLTFGGFVSWDGSWYRIIVEHGYGPPPVDGVQSPWPFFPLYPGLARLLVTVGFPSKAAMVLVTHAAFFVALVGVHRLATRHGGAEVAWTATWAIALFPAAFVFSMGYPSAIFVAASVWAFLFLEERRDVAASLCALVATTVRPNGIVVALAMAGGLVLLHLWSTTGRRRTQPGSSDNNTGHGVWRRAVVIVAPSALFVAIWAALNWHWTDSPLTFWHAKDSWDEVTLIEFFQHPARGEYPHMGLAIAALPVLVFAVRRQWVGWTLLEAMYLLPPLVLGVVGLGRYVNDLFPVFIAGGQLAAAVPRSVKWLLLAVSTAGMVLFAVYSVRYRYPP